MSAEINVNRLEAISNGLKTYTGRPCRRCNRQERYVNGHSCVACMKMNTASRDPTISKRYYDKKRIKGSIRPRSLNFSLDRFKKQEHLKYVKERELRPSARQKYELKRKYGMTLDEFYRLHVKQEGKCKACKCSKHNLVVDHCHSTGHIRGLLCPSCNKALGFARDSVDILKDLVEYLENEQYISN